jgi:hypothetical protein
MRVIYRNKNPDKELISLTKIQQKTGAHVRRVSAYTDTLLTNYEVKPASSAFFCAKVSKSIRRHFSLRSLKI